MRDNWSQHAKAHNNFSEQDKFLKCHFLFSLSTQKPCVEGTMSAAVRYVFHYLLILILLYMLSFSWASSLSKYDCMTLYLCLLNVCIAEFYLSAPLCPHLLP